LLVVLLTGEPAGIQRLRLGELIYLALLPIGFGVGLLPGWRWPLFGGTVSVV
jgi:hypothetical protein